MKRVNGYFVNIDTYDFHTIIFDSFVKLIPDASCVKTLYLMVFLILNDHEGMSLVSYHLF